MFFSFVCKKVKKLQYNKLYTYILPCIYLLSTLKAVEKFKLTENPITSLFAFVTYCDVTM